LSPFLEESEVRGFIMMERKSFGLVVLAVVFLLAPSINAQETSAGMFLGEIGTGNLLPGMGFDYLTMLQTGQDLPTPSTDGGADIPTGSFWPWAGFDLLPKLPGLEDLPTPPQLDVGIPTGSFWPGTGFDILPKSPDLEDIPPIPALPDMPITIFNPLQGVQ